MEWLRGRTLGWPDPGLPAAALVYAIITAVLFRELLPNVLTHVYSDVGDPLLNASILAWNATHLPLTAEWWNFPSFAPLSGVTAFTEHLLLVYPFASPVIWITDNPVLAYNLLFLAVGATQWHCRVRACPRSHRIECRWVRCGARLCVCPISGRASVASPAHDVIRDAVCADVAAQVFPDR